jgi:hypothetical protein
MVQKRDMAPVDPGAPAHADLQWMELLAYAHGCCLDHSEDAVVKAEPDPEAPLAADGAILH